MMGENFLIKFKIMSKKIGTASVFKLHDSKAQINNFSREIYFSVTGLHENFSTYCASSGISFLNNNLLLWFSVTDYVPFMLAVCLFSVVEKTNFEIMSFPGIFKILQSILNKRDQNSWDGKIFIIVSFIIPYFILSLDL